MRYSLFQKAAVATLFITQIQAFPQGRGSENDERTLDLPSPEEAAAGLSPTSSPILPSTSIIQILPKPTTLVVSTPTPTTTHKPTSTPNASHKELHREARALAKLASTETLAVMMKRAAIWVFESTKTAIS